MCNVCMNVQQMEADMNNNATKFDEGRIESGPYEGLYVHHLAVCMCHSSWDWPSFVIALGLEGLYDDEEPTMYPDDSDFCMIADAVDVRSCDMSDFLNTMPRHWDT